MNDMKKTEQAVTLFGEGYNCAQAIIKVFGDDLGIDDKTAKTLGRPLGGGIGHLGQMCGAVTGAAMVLAHLESTPVDEQEAMRETHYLVQALAADFEKKNGCLTCRDLLGADISTEEGKKKIVEEELVGKKCHVFVRDAASFIEELID